MGRRVAAFGLAASLVLACIEVLGGSAAEAQTMCASQSLVISAATPSFSAPQGIAVDASGNIYAADSNTKTLYRFNSSGTQTLAIPGTAGTPNFSLPVAIAVDSAGSIYTFDRSTNRIYRFNSAGTQTLTIPSTAATPHFSQGFGIAVDSALNIYVADAINKRLYKFNSSGTQTMSIPSTAATPNLSLPEGIAVDSAGNIYTADLGNKTLFEFNSAGTQTLAIPATAATPNLVTPQMVAVDGAGNIYTADHSTKTLYEFNSAGTQTLSIPPTAATPNLGLPFGIAARAGSLYTTDASTKRLYRFSPSTCLPQTITFTSTAPAGAVVAGPHYTVSATATSGLPVSFSIDATATSVCAITGAVVRFIGAGTCVVDANQSGGGAYGAAPQAQQSFAVGKGTQAITFVGPGTGSVGDSVTLSATGGASGNPVVFSVDSTSGPGVCHVSGLNGSTLMLTAVGTCVIDANQAGNASYFAAPQVMQSVTVTKGAQVITFVGPGSGLVGDSATLTATGGASGNPVVFSVDASSDPGVCHLTGINGSRVHYTAVGTCVIDANQAGNANYFAAPQVQQTIAVRREQSIHFGGLPDRDLSQSPFTVNAFATSGLPVTFSTTTPSVCTSGGPDGATITLVSAGTCTVAADQAGNATFGPAPTYLRSFTVSKVGQSIDFRILPPRRLAESPVTVSATASSGLTVEFTTITPAVCTSGGPDGATITLVRTGTCEVRASQPGDPTYSPALPVTRSFRVLSDG